MTTVVTPARAPAERLHWLAVAAARAGVPGATDLAVPPFEPDDEAWQTVARALGLTTAALAGGIARAFHLNAADLAHADKRALRLIPERIARKFRVFPMREDDRVIVAATADPSDLDAEQAVGFASGRRVVFELAAPGDIDAAIAGSYAPDTTIERLLSSVDARIADTVQVVEESHAAAVTASEVDAEPVVKLTSVILRDAIISRASDVHIEPGGHHGVVRFRIDGVMRVQMQLPMNALNRVVSRIKVLSKLDIADRLRPQDGRARIEVDRRTYDLRVSTVPTRDAEKAVIRVLRPDTATNLDECNITPRELRRIRRLLSQRDGIVIVTGPTGSGKTTTLYAAMKELATGDINVMTVEDPIEYELAGITQMQVEPRRNVTFPSALRAILRQDPDVILVGEIRDEETAAIAAQAALTGHLVLATLHTNDAIGAVSRLGDLGLDRATIAASLRGVIAQRLVRRLCDRCDGAGGTDCATCGGTGYHGRFPVHEVALVDPEMAERIATDATSRALHALAVAGGMRPMREVAAIRVAAGETSAGEVERVFGTLDADVAASSATDESPRVLVVDDDPVMRHTVSGVLASAGMRPETAIDGAAALERFDSGETWDLVITDLDMPRIDGSALITALRRTVRTSTLPVIVITGSTDHSSEIMAMDAGADDYVRKPIEPARFLSRVRAAIRRAAS